jgi:hypothetical protein
VDTERAQNLSRAAISATQRQSPEDPRYASHDRTLRETRDLYVTDAHDGD